MDLVCYIVSEITNQRAIRLHSQDFLKLDHLSDEFGGHILCCSENIMVKICHVITQNHKIKGSCDFMGGSPSWKITTLLSLVVISFLVVKI